MKHFLSLFFLLQAFFAHAQLMPNYGDTFVYKTRTVAPLITKFGVISDSGTNATGAAATLMGFPVGRSLYRLGTNAYPFVQLAQAYPALEIQVTVNLLTLDSTQAYPDSSTIDGIVAGLGPKIDQYFTPYNVYHIAVQNEFLNEHYYVLNASSVRRYAYLIKKISDLFKSKNTRYFITDGGITGPGMDWLVWNYLDSTGQSAAANAYKAARFKPSQWAGLPNRTTNPTFAPAIARIREYLSDVQSMANVLGINLHYTLPLTDSNAVDTMCLVYAIQAYKALSGNREVVFNEIGMNNQSPDVFKQTMSTLAKLGVRYGIFYNGKDSVFTGSDNCFTNRAGSVLRTNGTAAKIHLPTLRGSAPDLMWLYKDGKMKLPAYATSDTSYVLAPDAAGNIVARKVTAGSSGNNTPVDTGRGRTQVVTGYDLNKVRDSVQANIPTNNNQLTNGAGYISQIDTGRGRTQVATGYDLNKVRDSVQANIPTNNNQLTNGAGYITGVDTGRSRTQVVTGFDLNKVRDSVQANILDSSYYITDQHSKNLSAIVQRVSSSAGVRKFNADSLKAFYGSINRLYVTDSFIVPRVYIYNGSFGNYMYISNNDNDRSFKFNYAVGAFTLIPQGSYNYLLPYKNGRLAVGSDIMDSIMVHSGGNNVDLSNYYTKTESNSAFAPASHSHGITNIINLQSYLDAKVDKITGYGLSQKSYSASDSLKLAGIAPNATANSTDAYLLNFSNHTNKPTTIAGYGITDAFTQDAADARYKINGYVPAWADITGKPSFAVVATSGSYNDLLNKPTAIDLSGYHPLENQRLSTSSTPGFAGITATGPINLVGQSGTPIAPPVGTQLVYANSSGAFTLMGSNGFAFSINKNRLTANHTLYPQNKDYTAADSADLGTESANRLAVDALKLNIANNLSDLNNSATARINLGLGSIATLNSVSLTSNVTGLLPDANISSAATWNAKQNAIPLGTTSQYFRGDLSLATFPTALSAFSNDLALLTPTDPTLTLSGSYNGSIARTIGLNLANANTWTVGQAFNSSVTISGNLVATGGIQTAATGTNGNQYIPGGSTISPTVTTSQYLPNMVAGINIRVGIRGNTAGSPTAGNSYSSFIIGQHAVNIPASGTQFLYAQQILRPLAITTGAGVLTNSATLYSEDGTTGATNNYNIWAAGTAVNRFDGNVGIGTIPTDFLHVSAGTANGGITVEETNTGNNSPWISVKKGTNQVFWSLAGTANAFMTGTSTGDMIFRSSQNRNIHFGTDNGSGTSTPSLSLSAAGNIGIGTTSVIASAILNAVSTTKGVLLPRMTNTQRDAISSPAEGLLIYSLTDHAFEYYNGTVWKTISTN